MKTAILDSLALLSLLAGVWLACEALAMGHTIGHAGLVMLAGVCLAGFFQSE